MGSDRNEERGHKLRRLATKSGDGNVADWTACNAELLQKVIAKASLKHSALRFGYTRDGGAYAVGVYAGDDYFTDYVRPSEQIDAYLAALLNAFEEYEPAEGNTPTKRATKK